MNCNAVHMPPSALPRAAALRQAKDALRQPCDKKQLYFRQNRRKCSCFLFSVCSSRGQKFSILQFLPIKFLQLLCLEIFSQFLSVNTFDEPCHSAPVCLSTTETVLSRIWKSSSMLQVSIYSRSSFTTSSKSVMSLLPLICHSPVIPGLMLIRTRW